MGLGFGRLVNETSGGPRVFLLRDQSMGETEVVFRDVFGRAIMVVQVDGTTKTREAMQDNRTEYFGELDD